MDLKNQEKITPQTKRHRGIESYSGIKSAIYESQIFRLALA